jgi:hypothetical protein
VASDYLIRVTGVASDYVIRSTGVASDYLIRSTGVVGDYLIRVTGVASDISSVLLVLQMKKIRKCSFCVTKIRDITGIGNRRIPAPDVFSSHTHTLFFNIQFNIILPITSDLQSRIFLSRFPLKPSFISHHDMKSIVSNINKVPDYQYSIYTCTTNHSFTPLCFNAPYQCTTLLNLCSLSFWFNAQGWLHSAILFGNAIFYLSLLGYAHYWRNETRA